MKRTIALLVLAAAVAATGSVRAAQDTIEIPGFVRIAASHPALARTLYLQDEKSNGLVGFVIDLPAPAQKGAPFDLVAEPGATGLEDLDAYFYTDIEGTGTPCPYVEPEITANGGERGTMCEGATHAVIVLFGVGSDVDFTLVVPASE